jgi:hypothetical protein
MLTLAIDRSDQRRISVSELRIFDHDAQKACSDVLLEWQTGIDFFDLASTVVFLDAYLDTIQSKT